IEALGDRHERDAVLLELRGQPGEVDERAGEPVELVTGDDVDSTPPAATRSRRRRSAGRSVVAPENPPSSNRSGSAVHPSPAWLVTNASTASRWASIPPSPASATMEGDAGPSDPPFSSLSPGGERYARRSGGAEA